MKADVVAGRVAAVGPVAARTAALVYGWDRQTKTWPLTLGTCSRLRAVFTDELEVGEALEQWARQQRRQHVLQTAVAGRAYQSAGAARIAAQRYLAVLDEPGLGKTAMSLAGLQKTWNGRHLVICPKTAIESTWAEQIGRWSDGQVFAATGTAEQKRAAVRQVIEAQQGPRFLVTNPETLRTWMDKWCPRCERWKDQLVPALHAGMPGHGESWRIKKQDCPELFGFEWDTVIADECDRYLLGVRPQTGKMPLWGEGMVRLQTRRRLALTGTPFNGKEWNIFGILHWLDPRRFPGFWSGFVDIYFDKIDNGFGIEIAGLKPNKVDDFYDMLDQYSLRRTRAEVRTDLPKNLFIDHWVQMGPSHRRQYEAFDELGFTTLGDQSVVRSMGVLSKDTRLKQLAFGAMRVTKTKVLPVTSPKVDLLMNMLAERGLVERGPQFGSMKYIVASQFTSQLDWLQERLESSNIPTLAITGQVTGPARAAAVASFQGVGGPRVLLLNIAAGGVSITLDAQCDEMFILDEDEIEDAMVQLRGRIDNRGARVAPRVFHYIRTRGTIDERMAERNRAQAEMQHEILDGRRGAARPDRLGGVR